MNGAPCKVVKTRQHTVDNKRAYNSVEMVNRKTGAKIMERFRANESVETAQFDPAETCAQTHFAPSSSQLTNHV